MSDQKCTGTARIHVVMGSTSLLPIYATAADFLYRLSAAGKVVMMWTYMDCILKEKKEVGKIVDKHMQKRIISMEKRIADLEKQIQDQQSQNATHCQIQYVRPELLLKQVAHDALNNVGNQLFRAKLGNRKLFERITEQKQ